ncbi:MAG: class I SAM-dependent methyltransferase [Isosphaeraceae bacterium]
MAQIHLHPRTCPICGSGQESRLFAEANVDLAALDGFAFASRKLPEYMHWRLMECSHCDLLYADPAPTLDDLASLYRDADFDSSEEARRARRPEGRLTHGIVPRLPPDRDAAADIGTGDGIFLRELIDAGFREVVGIEPSAAPIAAAADDLRPLIRQEMFKPDTFPSGSMSLITCFQTIEHLADPLAFCRDAHRALKPGGALLLVGHNRRALSARLLGRKSPIFDIEHLQLFSPAAARALARAAGFDRVDVGVVYNRYPARYWARLFPFPRAVKPAVQGMLDRTGLGKVPIPLAAGNMAVACYR